MDSIIGTDEHNCNSLLRSRIMTDFNLSSETDSDSDENCDIFTEKAYQTPWCVTDIPKSSDFQKPQIANSSSSGLSAPSDESSEEDGDNFKSGEDGNISKSSSVDHIGEDIDMSKSSSVDVDHSRASNEYSGESNSSNEVLNSHGASLHLDDGKSVVINLDKLTKSKVYLINIAKQLKENYINTSIPIITKSLECNEDKKILAKSRKTLGVKKASLSRASENKVNAKEVSTIKKDKMSIAKKQNIVNKGNLKKVLNVVKKENIVKTGKEKKSPNVVKKEKIDLSGKVKSQFTEIANIKKPKQVSKKCQSVVTIKKEDIVKPPFSYKELIMLSLSSTPERMLTASDIFQYIKRTFLYYSQTVVGLAWQNGIRNNLSFFKCFSKTTVDGQKEGLWTFDREDLGWQLLQKDETKMKFLAELTYSGNLKKPPFSFKELIMLSLSSTPERMLPVSEIIQYIKRAFLYYSQTVDGLSWQNCIRNNLNQSQCFWSVKGLRHDTGRRGRKELMWTFDPEDLVWQKLQKDKAQMKFLAELKNVALEKSGLEEIIPEMPDQPFIPNSGNLKKPPFSYKELIMLSLFSIPERMLTVSDIFQYIKRMFLYYSQTGLDWQSRIRNNLHIFKCFSRVDGLKEEVWTFDLEDIVWQRLQKDKTRLSELKNINYSPDLNMENTMSNDDSHRYRDEGIGKDGPRTYIVNKGNIKEVLNVVKKENIAKTGKAKEAPNIVYEEKFSNVMFDNSNFFTKEKALIEWKGSNLNGKGESQFKKWTKLSKTFQSVVNIKKEDIVNYNSIVTKKGSKTPFSCKDSSHQYRDAVLVKDGPRTNIVNKGNIRRVPNVVKKENIVKTGKAKEAPNIVKKESIANVITKEKALNKTERGKFLKNNKGTFLDLAQKQESLFLGELVKTEFGDIVQKQESSFQNDEFKTESHISDANFITRKTKLVSNKSVKFVSAKYVVKRRLGFLPEKSLEKGSFEESFRKNLMRADIKKLTESLGQDQESGYISMGEDFDLSSDDNLDAQIAEDSNNKGCSEAKECKDETHETLGRIMAKLLRLLNSLRNDDLFLGCWNKVMPPPPDQSPHACERSKFAEPSMPDIEERVFRPDIEERVFRPDIEEKVVKPPTDIRNLKQLLKEEQEIRDLQNREKIKAQKTLSTLRGTFYSIEKSFKIPKRIKNKVGYKGAKLWTQGLKVDETATYEINKSGGRTLCKSGKLLKSRQIIDYTPFDEWIDDDGFPITPNVQRRAITKSTEYELKTESLFTSSPKRLKEHSSDVSQLAKLRNSLGEMSEKEDSGSDVEVMEREFKDEFTNPTLIPKCQDKLIEFSEVRKIKVEVNTYEEFGFTDPSTDASSNVSLFGQLASTWIAKKKPLNKISISEDVHMDYDDKKAEEQTRSNIQN